LCASAPYTSWPRSHDAGFIVESRRSAEREEGGAGVRGGGQRKGTKEEFMVCPKCTLDGL